LETDRMNDCWKACRRLITTPDLAGLGPTPRASRFPPIELNHAVDRFIKETNLPTARHALIRSAALLWHDYLDESHTISQEIHSPDGSFLHGIMHRREPDYGNAKYWFQRVGRHACFPDIIQGVTRLLETKGETELGVKLAPRGNWDPFALVDACEQVTNLPSALPRIPTLQAIQSIEFECLLHHLVAT
jgi:hypothetical protein